MTRRNEIQIECFGSEMNEEVGEWFGRHDHPLLNHVILENMFQYMRKDDLLACRGVSKQWNVLTIPFIRFKFTIGIQLSNESLSHPRNPEAESTRKIEDFVAVFSKNKLGIPFGKFKLGPFPTSEGVGQQFLTLCGERTTELHLCQYDEGNEIFKVEDVSQILRSMKRLEKLTMSDKLVTDSKNVVELFPGSKPELSTLKAFTLGSDNPEGPNTCCPTFLEELITAAGNISDLTVGDLIHFSADDGDELNFRFNSFQALSVIENLGRESSIRRFCLDGHKLRPYVEILRRMAAKQNGLNLKALSVSTDHAEESDHLQVVELFKDTLEEINICGCSCFSSFTNFPKMPKLGSLNFHISQNFDSSLVNLKKIFPMLKELVLRGGRDQVYDEFLPQSEPCLTMKSLNLFYGHHLTLNAFNHVLTIFPRLTELRLQIKVDGTDILRQVWSCMTQLESLYLRGQLQTEESMDSLFTGISTETIRAITGVLKDLDKMTVQCRRDTIENLRNRHCQPPSIGSLTNLRRLELNVFGDGNGSQSSYLSDVTGFLGFYSLKHLSYLVVEECEFTMTCCEILITEMEVGLESYKFTSPN